MKGLLLGGCGAHVSGGVALTGAGGVASLPHLGLARRAGGRGRPCHGPTSRSPVVSCWSS